MLQSHSCVPDKELSTWKLRMESTPTELDELLSKSTTEITELNGKILALQDELSRALAGGMTQSEPVDLSGIPEAYTDAVQTTVDPVPFEMTLVPSDAAAGLAPFYMSRHEVTWGMLNDWMYCLDLNATEAARAIEAGERPSPLWGTLAQQFQVPNKTHPAMGMTRNNAEAFCRFLSEQTGRRYRLPTLDEWQHALSAGGGVPADLDAYVLHAGNSPKRESNDEPLTSPIGTTRPNAIGIHDMLGSVAEWVTGTGDDRYVVGGAINNSPDEINEAWRAVEDVPVWSASYPNLPYSRFWYVDYYYTGFRLVCEAPSVAQNPPVRAE